MKSIEHGIFQGSHQYTNRHDRIACGLIDCQSKQEVIMVVNFKEGSLWIPDWSKRTTVGSTMTDDGTGSLFSTITASYTTPLWLAEKANLRKIS